MRKPDEYKSRNQRCGGANREQKYENPGEYKSGKQLNGSANREKIRKTWRVQV